MASLLQSEDFPFTEKKMIKSSIILENRISSCLLVPYIPMLAKDCHQLQWLAQRISENKQTTLP